MDVPAGSCLYGPDEPAGHFFLVIDGLVALERIGADGSETALDVRAGGDTFGDCVLSVLPHAGETARTLLRTKVRQWPASEVMALMGTDTEAALAAVRMLVSRAAVSRERILLLGKETAPRRVARTLLYLKAKIGPALPPLGFATVGALAATSAAVAGDCLATFAREGLVAITPAGIVVRPALAEWLRSN